MKKLVILILLLVGCNHKDIKKELNEVAEDYVKLTLELGLYQPDLVDAYYGPKEWREKLVKLDEFPYDLLENKALKLIEKLNLLEPGTREDKDRKDFLQKQLRALETLIQMQNGVSLSFDEETKKIYDVEVPSFTPAYFDEKLKELESIIPGKGELGSRLTQYRNKFIIPREKLDTVFRTAVEESRLRTKKYITDLAQNENFKIEFVSKKPWGAYNWYQGNNQSIIQFNTDIDAYIDRAVDLACHEGYPGHHVYNSILETKLYKEKNYTEYCVYPLYSPQSLIAEGTANYGVEVVFPPEDRIKFEKEVLFPLAGLDPSKVEEYYKVLALTSRLSFAANEASRGYLNGKMSRDEVIRYMMKYLFMTKQRAEKRIEFMEKYRTYIINYTIGQYLVNLYVEKQIEKSEGKKNRWEVFSELMSRPVTPESLNK